MLEQTEAANGADYIASNKTDSLQVLVIVQEAQTLEARSLSDLLYTCAELQSPQPPYGPLLSTAAGSTGTFLRVRFGFLFLGISPDDIEQRLRVSLECASFSLPSPRQIIERVLERVLLGPLSQLCRTGANACGSGEDSTVFSPAADADAEADSAVSPRLLLSPSLLLFLRDVFESTAFSLNAFQLTFEVLESQIYTVLNILPLASFSNLFQSGFFSHFFSGCCTCISCFVIQQSAPFAWTSIRVGSKHLKRAT